MQAWNYYEAVSIQERENAKAAKAAADQAATDLPGTEVTEARVYSKIVPLPNPNLRINGPRWYVKAIIHNLSSNSKVEALYRVWREQEDWRAAQVKIIP